MARLSGLVLVAVAMFQGSTENPAQADKNGNFPVILNPLAGKIPSKRVLSGTVARNMRLIAGKTALVAYQETEENEFGRQFNFTVANNDVSISETLAGYATLGAPSVIKVTADEVAHVDDVKAPTA